jgi:nucleotide-binding universal stress UspA family protein
MKNLVENFGKLPTTKIKYSCQFHESPRLGLIEDLNRSKSDVVFVATRGKHGIEGLFNSSFAEYMLKFSPCSIFILRNK